MSESDGTYWEGATWVYQASIENSAGGASNQSYTLSLPVGSELELLYGELVNTDTSSRNATVELNSGANRLARLLNSIGVSAGFGIGFPVAGSAASGQGPAAGQRFIMTGPMRLIITLASVAASQGSACGLVCRIRGGVPTVVEAGEASAVITINIEEVL